MRKQIKFSTGIFAAAMMLLFSLHALAQSNKVEAPSVIGTVAQPSPPTGQKQITRAQLFELSGDAQADVLANLGTYTITDLVNATPGDLAHRQDNIFYMPLADFINAGNERQMHVLKNSETYKIVQDASLIPKIEITMTELMALPEAKRIAIRSSSDYLIIN